MSMTMQELRNQLSAIEPDETTYSGIGPAEIPLLEQLLRDKQPTVASRAVFALSRVADAKAVALLSQAAADSRPEVRVAVAASVSHLKPADGSKILLRLLADPELGVRKFALQAVTSNHDAAVHAKLRELIARDPAPWIRDAAQSRLRDLNINLRQ